MRAFWTVLALTCFCFSSMAANESDHVMLQASEIQWKEGPAVLPPGVKSYALYGDPSVAGPFSLRLKLPAKYKIPPHFHPQDENITVLSGSFFMGLGDDAKGKMTEIKTGGFASMKAGTHHFARAEKEAIIQLNGMGPWGITYVNPADDPRNKK
ncbi:cupin domain-containing protein [Bdellovibrio sp. 22V]|uniref:cupin domain-containing protein n=1 Tax=Bdellovibrio TaxID=958 RepID=UPI0025433AD9|nr:cupin domain-containing protein [Bdellovibrio sp. 22V]WII71100.1 cupin domain-containing protein [Bdellovibrio sp. 22V]